MAPTILTLLLSWSICGRKAEVSYWFPESDRAPPGGRPTESTGVYSIWKPQRSSVGVYWPEPIPSVENGNGSLSWMMVEYCLIVIAILYQGKGRLRGLAVACWTTDHYHPCSNPGVGISEGCFVFHFHAYLVHKSGRKTSIINHLPGKARTMKTTIITTPTIGKNNIVRKQRNTAK